MKTKKEKLNQVLSEAIEIIKQAEDKDILNLLGDGIINDLLIAIADPKNRKKEDSIYDYLLKNKNRLNLLALIRLAIHRNYSIKGKVNGRDVFVSPNHIQWYKDGVMFLQGEKQFEGLIGLYENGNVKFGILNRAILKGESIGPNDMDFIDLKECANRSKQLSIPQKAVDLDKTIVDLKSLLENKNLDESTYQKYFISNPWVFGAQYNKVESHKEFNDDNIPDFTATRVRDNTCDILEIKQPFLSLFNAKNAFRSEFHNAWNQAEKYLDFARREPGYLLREKNIKADNPKCFLLIGHDLSAEQIKLIRRKERMNPAITILTYNDVLTYVKNTIAFIKELKINP